MVKLNRCLSLQPIGNIVQIEQTPQGLLTLNHTDDVMSCINPTAAWIAIDCNGHVCC